MSDSKLIDYAQTDHQRACVQAWLDHGSSHKAAEATGLNDRSIRKAVQTAKVRAARQGYSPEHDMVHPTPDGFALKGNSTLYRRGEPEPVLQWVKTNQDHQRQAELMREVVASMCESIQPLPPSITPPTETDDALLNLYVITDYHLGMMAWHEETRGDDWDTRIAETLLVRWFERAIELSPAAEVGVFAQLGDLLHWDGMEAVTPASKHILDADTRFQKLVRVAIRVLRQVISMLLNKHKTVHIIMAEGNHDTASSVWLREMFAALYSNDPRVTIDVSADPYYCYEHGSTSLFFHHGHKRKPDSIHDVFASKFREVFGRTRHSYAHMGHMHHIHVKETTLMVVEQHRTLAASDAYASRGGWSSGREASAITYHKEHGQVGRVTITPDMVESAA